MLPLGCFFATLLIVIALSFGYFELLAGLQDRSVWSREKARFADLNGLLYRSGLDEFIWVEWVEATAKLFDDLAATETKDAALNVIETRFNNADESIEILTHLRVKIPMKLWRKGPSSCLLVSDFLLAQRGGQPLRTVPTRHVHGRVHYLASSYSLRIGRSEFTSSI